MNGTNGRVFEARGFNLAYAARVAADKNRLGRIDRRLDHGEEARQTIGEVEGWAFFLAFTQRGDSVRIISARKAQNHEESAYREGKTGADGKLRRLGRAKRVEWCRVG